MFYGDFLYLFFSPTFFFFFGYQISCFCLSGCTWHIILILTYLNLNFYGTSEFKRLSEVKYMSVFSITKLSQHQVILFSFQNLVSHSPNLLQQQSNSKGISALPTSSVLSIHHKPTIFFRRKQISTKFIKLNPGPLVVTFLLILLKANGKHRTKQSRTTCQWCSWWYR